MSDDLGELLHRLWHAAAFELTPDDVRSRLDEGEPDAGAVDAMSFGTAPEVLTVEELAVLLRVNEKTRSPTRNSLPSGWGRGDRGMRSLLGSPILRST